MKLRDLIPAKARHTVYVVLSFVSAIVPVFVAVLQDGWQLSDLPIIVTGVLSSGGFTLAAANTVPKDA